MTPCRLSVIIPALDEEDLIGYAVRSVKDEAEVIVVDGGSRDRTRALAEADGATVLSVPAGRGRQLDAGARRASGDWLVFLHADTRLAAGWAPALRRLGAHVVGGAFRFTIDSPGLRYRVVEAGVALRCRVWNLPFGDQCLFVRREVYETIGGFLPVPLMEDVAFVRRLSRVGPLVFPPVRALTSARRWERHGILATTAQNWWLLGLYAVGRPPEQLARLYDRQPK
jgi:rSAM/selenodomain-associated transferase 2